VDESAISIVSRIRAIATTGGSETGPRIGIRQGESGDGELLEPGEPGLLDRALLERIDRLVDLAQALRIGRAEVAPAGRRRHLGEGLLVDRDRHALHAHPEGRLHRHVGHALRAQPDGVDPHIGRLRERRGLERRELARVRLAVGQDHEDARADARAAVAVGAVGGVLQLLDAERDRVADRGSHLGAVLREADLRERLDDDLMVERERHEAVRVPGEAHDPDEVVRSSREALAARDEARRDVLERVEAVRGLFLRR